MYFESKGLLEDAEHELKASDTSPPEKSEKNLKIAEKLLTRGKKYVDQLTKDYPPVSSPQTSSESKRELSSPPLPQPSGPSQVASPQMSMPPRTPQAPSPVSGAGIQQPPQQPPHEKATKKPPPWLRRAKAPTPSLEAGGPIADRRKILSQLQGELASLILKFLPLRSEKGNPLESRWSDLVMEALQLANQELEAGEKATSSNSLRQHLEKANEHLTRCEDFLNGVKRGLNDNFRQQLPLTRLTEQTSLPQPSGPSQVTSPQMLMPPRTPQDPSTVFRAHLPPPPPHQPAPLEATHQLNPLPTQNLPPVLPPQSYPAPVSAPVQQVQMGQQAAFRPVNIQEGFIQEETKLNEIEETLYQMERTFKTGIKELFRIPNKTSDQSQEFLRLWNILETELPKEKEALNQGKFDFLTRKLQNYPYANQEERNIDELGLVIIQAEFNLKPYQEGIKQLESAISQNYKLLDEAQTNEEKQLILSNLSNLINELKFQQRTISPEITRLAKLQAQYWDAKMDKSPHLRLPPYSSHDLAERPGLAARLNRDALYLTKNASYVEEALKAQLTACNQQQAKESQEGKTINGKKVSFQPAHPQDVNAIIAQTTGQSPIAIDPATQQPYEGVDRAMNATLGGVVGQVGVGISERQGQRPSMEDASLAAYFPVQIGGTIYPVHLLGVFDGHGGAGAAQFAQLRFQKTLDEKLRLFNPNGLTNEGIWKALKATCFQIDQDFKETKDSSGTTATVSVILNNQLWTANVGNSRAVLNIDGFPYQISEDMSLDDPKYAERIQSAGGEFVNDRGVTKVRDSSWGQDLLEPPRRIGGPGYDTITASPRITMIPLADIPLDTQLILGCDGVYDVATTEEIVKLLQDYKGAPPEFLATLISESVRLSGSQDNISVVVVNLRLYLASLRPG